MNSEDVPFGSPGERVGEGREDAVDYLADGFDECYKFLEPNAGLKRGNNFMIISSRTFSNSRQMFPGQIRATVQILPLNIL